MEYVCTYVLAILSVFFTNVLFVLLAFASLENGIAVQPLTLLLLLI